MEYCNGGSLFSMLREPQNVFGFDDHEFLTVLHDIGGWGTGGALGVYGEGVWSGWWKLERGFGGGWGREGFGVDGEGGLEGGWRRGFKRFNDFFW